MTTLKTKKGTLHLEKMKNPDLVYGVLRVNGQDADSYFFQVGGYTISALKHTDTAFNLLVLSGKYVSLNVETMEIKDAEYRICRQNSK